MRRGLAVGAAAPTMRVAAPRAEAVAAPAERWAGRARLGLDCSSVFFHLHIKNDYCLIGTFSRLVAK